MGILHRLFGRSDDGAKLAAHAKELATARGDLRKSVNQLGQEVWEMVETGDPLRALVHGAQNAKFRSDIRSGAADE